MSKPQMKRRNKTFMNVKKRERKIRDDENILTEPFERFINLENVFER